MQNINSIILSVCPEKRDILSTERVTFQKLLSNGIVIGVLFLRKENNNPVDDAFAFLQDFDCVLHEKFNGKCTFIYDEDKEWKNFMFERDYYCNHDSFERFVCCSLFLKSFMWNYFIYNPKKWNTLKYEIFEVKDEHDSSLYSVLLIASQPDCLYDSSIIYEKFWKKLIKNLNNKFNVNKKIKNVRKPFISTIRFEVFKKCNFKCVMCGATKDDKPLHVDHILPVSRGGTDELSNLQILCESCNLSKSNLIYKVGEKNETK